MTNSSTMECPDARISLGVYVLGAIDPAERALVDAHLASCQECRDELAGLAGLPALLARVSKEEAIGLADTDGDTDAPPLGEVEPPRELLATVLDLTAARRRRRRWRDGGLATAAAAIVAVGVFAGLQLGSNPAHQPTAQALGVNYGPTGQMETATGRSGDMTATVSYSTMGWGTYLAAKVTGIPMGTNCKLYAIEKNGNRVLVGNWVTDDLEGTVYYPGSTALPSSDFTAFEVTVGQGQAIQVQA